MERGCEVRVCVGGVNPTGPRLMVARNKMDSVPGAR